MIIPASAISQSKAGDIQTLAELDARGIVLGAGETAEDFAQRLQLFNANFSKMESSLAQNGKYTIEDVTVSKKARIPKEILTEANQLVTGRFAFENDWVPGFFINPDFSLLFGGCAYTFFPDFFALFIIRSSFRTKKRWLFYQRQELLAHEICHIARLGLGSDIYEEPFAYMTASTAFRRMWGGIFRSQIDSFAFLGAALLQLLAQVLRTYCFPAMPLWPFIGVLVAIVMFLVIRHWGVMRRLSVARRNLIRSFGEKKAEAVLFRCTDSEVTELAKCSTQSRIVDFLQQHSSELRWQVIQYRFPLEGLGKND